MFLIKSIKETFYFFQYNLIILNSNNYLKIFLMTQKTDFNKNFNQKKKDQLLVNFSFCFKNIFTFQLGNAKFDHKLLYSAQKDI